MTASGAPQNTDSIHRIVVAPGKTDRVQPVFPEEKLHVISDNKQYDAFEIATDKIRVNGKAIWFARVIER